jgi:hypothetical protein
MPKFVTIGYGDRAGYDATPAHLLQQAHARDAQLRERGAIVGRAGVPVQVRNAGAAGVTTASGPVGRSPLPVAGFAIIEADSLAEAVELVSGSPCAVAHGVVEVWPLDDA